MSVQTRNDGRAVARPRYHIRTSRSPEPATAVAVNTGSAGADPASTSEAPHQPGGSHGVSAQDSAALDRRNDVIVGHRLATGQMFVHAPGQPCDLCASALTPGRHRRPEAGKGPVRRVMQSLIAAAATPRR